jgi:hypothetical protein
MNSPWYENEYKKQVKRIIINKGGNIQWHAEMEFWVLVTSAEYLVAEYLAEHVVVAVIVDAEMTRGLPS